MDALEHVSPRGVTPSELSPNRKARIEVLCQHSRGATDRVWSMPYSIERSASMDPADPMLQTNIREAACIQNTISFLGTHAPAALHTWIEGMRDKLDEPYEPLIRAALEYKHAPEPHEVRYDIQPSPAPHEVTLPLLAEGHWAYQRHFNPGRQRNSFDDYEEVSRDEVRQDIGSIRRYLHEYDRLAKGYTGEQLYEATDTPKFTDPYYTCIDVCVFDCKLPSHFLALIHYGIGLQFLWRTGVTSVHRRFGEDTIMPLFDALTSLYVRDFSRSPSPHQRSST